MGLERARRSGSSRRSAVYEQPLHPQGPGRRAGSRHAPNMESIYNLVPEEYDPVKFGDKGPMYRSRYDPKAGVTGSTFNTHGSTKVLGAGEAVRKASGTMGRRTE